MEEFSGLYQIVVFASPLSKTISDLNELAEQGYRIESFNATTGGSNFFLLKRPENMFGRPLTPKDGDKAQQALDEMLSMMGKRRQAFGG